MKRSKFVEVSEYAHTGDSVIVTGNFSNHHFDVGTMLIVLTGNLDQCLCEGVAKNELIEQGILLTGEYYICKGE